METHFDPKNAKSDGANMLSLELAEGILTRLARLHQTVSSL
jgi:2-dehydro-3-deoxyphosphooctonate aldolase (KDO 8-P synthase)